MKVRRTVWGILISLTIVLVVFTVALVVNSGNVIRQLVVSELSNFNDSASQLTISYDNINTSARPGIVVTGLELSNSEKSYVNVSEIKVSAGFSDLFRMLLGINPNTVKVSVNGVSLHADDSLFEIFKERNSLQKTDKKTKKFTLPFDVEATLSSMTADIDMLGLTSSIGNITAFARIDKNGIAIANGLIPHFYGKYNDSAIFVEDLRLSTDGTGKTMLSSKEFSYGEDILAKGLSAISEKSGRQIKVVANIGSGVVFGAKTENIVVNSSFDSDIIRADISVAEGSYEINKSEASIKNLTLNASVTNKKHFLLSAKSSAGGFGCEAEAEIYADVPDLNNFKEESTICLRLKDVSTPVIDFKDDIILYFFNGDRITLDAKVTEGFTVNTTVLLSDESASFSANLEKVRTLDFKKGFEKYTPFVSSWIGDKSMLNGKIEFSGQLNEVFPDGQLMMDVSIDDLNGTSRRNSLRAVCDAQSDNGFLYIQDFIISLFDYSSVFAGSVDIKNFSPKGELNVIDDLLGKSVANAVFSRFPDSFEVKITAERFKGFEIDTSVTFPDGELFEVNSMINTKYASYPVNISIDSSKDLVINVSDSENMLSFVFGHNGLVDFNSDFNGLEVKLDYETSVLVSGNAKGVFSFRKKVVDFVLDGLFVSLSDSMALSCDIIFNNTALKISDFNLFVKNAGSSIKGYAEVFYDELTNLGKIDIAQIRRLDFSSLKSLTTDSFRVKTELFTDSGDYCNILYSDHTLFTDLSSNLFEIPLRVKILGTKDGGYYADIDYKTVSFEAAYEDRKASLYKVSGNIGGFELTNMNIMLDFAQRTLSGGVSFVHIMHKRTGDVQNRADININAHLSWLGDLFKGTVLKNAKYDVDLEIKNAIIGNTFAIPDTQINLYYSDGIYDIEGNMIHGFYRTSDSYINIFVNPELSFGFEACGYLGDSVDLSVNDIFFPINMVNPLLDLAEVSFLKGDITGNVLLYGPKRDLTFYGMLYCSTFEVESFYIPQQLVSINNIAISLNEHTIEIPLCPFTGYSVLNRTQFRGKTRLEAVFQSNALESFEVLIKLGDKPVDVWIPTKLNKTMNLSLKGSCSNGWVSFSKDTSGKFCIKGDSEVSDMYASFELPQMPDWFGINTDNPILDFTLRTGKNVELAYPNIDDPFVSLTAKEGESIRLKLDAYKNFSSEGSLAVKTGRVYYFNSDFYVTDGQVFFEDNPFMGSGFKIYIDVSAKTRQYDAKGEPLDIYLDINKASLDNLSMRFSSSSGLSENEIIAILGQAMIPTGDDLNLNSVASFAYAATEAVQKLNLFDSDLRYSLSSTLRDSLGLDFLSAKTPLLSNILLDAIPGNERDVSLIAKYMNGTSIFAGKYFTPDIFGRITLLLAADSNARKHNGYFISQDLSLDVEMSVEWETPYATWTMSMEPDELSVFSFLDTIGLTVSKVIRY